MAVTRATALAVRTNTNALQDALLNFQNRLGKEDRKEFDAQASIPDASAVINLVTKLDKANRDRKGRCFASRLHVVLESINQFSLVVSTFVSSNPATAALVWGSVQFTLLLVSRSLSRFERISELLMEIGRECPRFDSYQRIFQDSTRVQNALCSYYARIVRICADLYVDMQKPEPLWRELYTNPMSLFTSRSLIEQNEVRDLARNVAKEVQLANVQSQHDERKSKRELAAIKRERQRRIERLDLLNKLSAHDFKTPFSQLQGKRCNGTIEWLDDDAIFKRWRTSPASSMLWLTGKLGGGKSVVMAYAIGLLFTHQATASSQISYMFCRFDDSASLSASRILRCLIRQCLSEDSMSEEIENALRERLDDIPHLESLFLRVIANNPLHFAVVDGLDDMDRTEQRKLCESLSSVCKQASRPFKVLLSCRHKVPEKLRDSNVDIIEYPLPAGFIRQDIEAYIEYAVVTSIENQDLSTNDPALVSQIATDLLNGAENMFLWVELMLREICRQPTDDSIRQILTKLPATLTELYCQIFSSIAASGRSKEAAECFKFVAVARRPLLLPELQEAMAVEPYAKSSQPGRFINNISQIFDWFGGLIIQEEIQGEVRFAHPTILQTVSDKTQLRTQIWAHIDMDKASKRFGITCTTYLSFDDFKKRQLVKQSGLQDIDMTRPIWQASIGSAMPRLAKLINKMHTTSPSSSGVSRGIAQTLNEAIEPEFSTTHKIQRDHPFLQYATEFWEFHSRDFEPIDRIWPLWIALSSSTDSLIRQPWPILDGTRQSQLAFQKYIVQEKHFALLVWCQSGPNPLPKNQMKEILDEAFFTGATAFVTKFLRFLFDLALDVSMLGELLRGIILSDDAPAASRIMSLRSSSIGVLFEWDEIRAEVGPFHAKAYPTLLAVAAAAGEVKYVEELLAAQETINKKPDDGPARCRALEVAARAGHMKMIELMMAVPAEIDPKITFDALKAMISSGHASDVARLLTKRSTAKAVDGGLPALLQMAARDGYVDMVAMLISAGVNVNDVYTRSALEVAAQGGHAEVVDQLFSAGATADTTTGGLPALLQMAAADGCADIVATLISIGVDVNEVFKCTALEVAVQGGHAQVVDHLLSAGATAYTITGGLGKLVWDAAYSGSARIIPKLVSQGAKVDEIVNGMTALEVAARNGHADVTKELLVAGANYDKTALLEAAVRNGHANVTRELLLAGASCDNAGLLKGAVRDGHANVTMELLLAGASCDKAALLEDAVGNGYANVTKVLLAAGATIRAQEVHRPSNWLLSRAASKGNVGIIGMLLEAGAYAGHLDDPKNAAVIASKNKHEEAGRILFQAVEANGRIKDCKTCTRKSRMGGRLVHDT